MIIQSISLLDTLDKDINTFSMRVKEWYGWHFPELVRIVADNYKCLPPAAAASCCARCAALLFRARDLPSPNLYPLAHLPLSSFFARNDT
jgi:hypothetical protein